MDDKFSAWQFNVQDRYKAMTVEEIKTDLQANALPCSVLMTNIAGDFNFSCLVRSSNGFNLKEVFYYGNKKWDKRGALGVYHYTPVNYLSSFEDVKALKDRYTLVALENTNGASLLSKFEWPKNPLILIGEEGLGLSQEILDICDYTVEIPMFGSVRSYNAAVAGSIAIYDYVSKNT